MAKRRTKASQLQEAAEARGFDTLLVRAESPASTARKNIEEQLERLARSLPTAGPAAQVNIEERISKLTRALEAFKEHDYLDQDMDCLQRMAKFAVRTFGAEEMLVVRSFLIKYMDELRETHT